MYGCLYLLWFPRWPVFTAVIPCPPQIPAKGLDISQHGLYSAMPLLDYFQPFSSILPIFICPGTLIQTWISTAPSFTNTLVSSHAQTCSSFSQAISLTYAFPSHPLQMNSNLTPLLAVLLWYRAAHIPLWENLPVNYLQSQPWNVRYSNQRLGLFILLISQHINQIPRLIMVSSISCATRFIVWCNCTSLSAFVKAPGSILI